MEVGAERSETQPTLLDLDNKILQGHFTLDKSLTLHNKINMLVSKIMRTSSLKYTKYLISC